MLKHLIDVRGISVSEKPKKIKERLWIIPDGEQLRFSSMMEGCCILSTK